MGSASSCSAKLVAAETEGMVGRVGGFTYKGSVVLPRQLDVRRKGMAQQRTAAGALSDSSKHQVHKKKKQQLLRGRTCSRISEESDCIVRVLNFSCSSCSSSSSRSRNPHYTPVDSSSLSPEQREAAILERRFTAGGYNNEMTQGLTTREVILMAQHSHNQWAKMSAINELTTRLASKDPQSRHTAMCGLADNPAAVKELIRISKGQVKKGIRQIPCIQAAAAWAIKAAIS
jgi:hypothetical protein